MILTYFSVGFRHDEFCFQDLDKVQHIDKSVIIFYSTKLCMFFKCVTENNRILFQEAISGHLCFYKDRFEKTIQVRGRWK